MNNIKWEDGAVCFANKIQHFYDGDMGIIEKYAHTYNDFQLNEIRTGDYIEASELDTEHKYNDAVGVLGLFGFASLKDHKGYDKHITSSLTLGDGFYCYSTNGARKLTYPQLMAIGKLKRAMIEKSAPKIAPDLTPDVVNKPAHYQFFEGVEVIEIIASSMTREQFKGYCLGNRIKYRLRAGNKDDIAQEIAKSDKYVELYDEHKHLCK